MGIATAQRRPRITFEVIPPPLADSLPRMDVAGFVGVATTGPIDVPVLVEDVTRYREVFGTDPVLARDPATGRDRLAHLGPAVEAFLHNGGRRCWVVRVAGDDAVATAFEVPGLVYAVDGAWQTPRLWARSRGSGFDHVRLAASLAADGLPAITRIDAQRLLLAARATLVPGDLLRGSNVRDGRRRLLVVAATEVVNGATACTWDRAWRVTDDPDPGVAFTPEDAPFDTPGDWVVERVTLTLGVVDGQRLVARLEGLGCDPRHPRFVGALPDDQALFAALLPGGRPGAGGTTAATPAVAALWDEVGSPRFPLAAAAGPAQAAASWLPLALPERLRLEAAVAPVSDTAPGSARARAGLTAFAAELFLDADLRGATGPELLARADTRASRQQPLPLRGLHAVLPIGEVTLLTVPDAAHPGWREVTEELDPPPSAPVLAPPRQRAQGWIELRWEPTPGADRYVVERARQVDLLDGDRVLDGPAPLGPDADGRPGVALPPLTGCGGLVAFRVRGIVPRHGTSPWSNTVHVIEPPAAFTGPDTPLPAPPLAVEAGETGPVLTFRSAEDPQPAAVAIEVEHADDPLFAAADRTLPEPDAEVLPLGPARERHRFHRARYVATGAGPPRTGPWSHTVVQLAPPRRQTVLHPWEDRGTMLEVQQAALELATARGDVLAVLALPDADVGGGAAAHLSALGAGQRHRADVRGARSQDRTAEHGAAFAPWTVTRTPAGVRSIPPDGAMAGVLARRASEHGAWLSPANQPVRGVVALTRELEGAEGDLLATAGLNRLEQVPHGLVATSASTMSLEPTTRPIEVRRLLQLLRRIVVRHGGTYVFEPHGHRFRTLVHRQFDGLLGGLYDRGAFAGATPGEAYQVVTDRTVNPPESVAAGRFVVELRIAPTQPMAFLRIRLVQAGAGDTLAVEVVS